MTDNFNLKKFLSENKTIQNSNPFLREESTEDKEAHLDAEKDDAAHIADLEKDMEDDEKLDEVEVTEEEVTEMEDEITEAEEEVEVEAEEEVEVEAEETDDVEIDAPEMEGDEGEILSHLMKALGMAKSMGDEKLTKQIGNTVTFLTRQYISGE